MAKVNTILPYVFPKSLTFEYKGKGTRKLQKILSIFNVLPYPVKFKITCTAPSRYRISPCEGQIVGRGTHDIIVEYVSPSISKCGTVDKIRIEVTDTCIRKEYGSEIVESRLIEPDDEEHYRESLSSRREIQNEGVNRNRGSQTSIWLLAIVTIILLILLTKQEDGYRINIVPEYLVLGDAWKMFLGGLIGAIVTCTLFYYCRINENVIIYNRDL